MNMNDFFGKAKAVLVPAALALFGALQSPEVAPVIQAAPPWVAPLVSFLAALVYGGERVTRK